EVDIQHARYEALRLETAAHSAFDQLRDHLPIEAAGQASLHDALSVELDDDGNTKRLGGIPRTDDLPQAQQDVLARTRLDALELHRGRHLEPVDVALEDQDGRIHRAEEAAGAEVSHRRDPENHGADDERPDDGRANALAHVFLPYRSVHRARGNG